MAAGFIVSIIRRAQLKPVFAAAILIGVVGGLFYMFLFAN
jgi:hypothetical protein